MKWIIDVNKELQNWEVTIRDKKSLNQICKVNPHNDKNGFNSRLISTAPELLYLAKLILKEWESPTEGVERGELIARLSQYSLEARELINFIEGKQNV